MGESLNRGVEALPTLRFLAQVPVPDWLTIYCRRDRHEQNLLFEFRSLLECVQRHPDDAYYARKLATNLRKQIQVRLIAALNCQCCGFKPLRQVHIMRGEIRGPECSKPNHAPCRNNGGK